MPWVGSRRQIHHRARHCPKTGRCGGPQRMAGLRPAYPDRRARPSGPIQAAPLAEYESRPNCRCGESCVPYAVRSPPASNGRQAACAHRWSVRSSGPGLLLDARASSRRRRQKALGEDAPFDGGPARALSPGPAASYPDLVDEVLAAAAKGLEAQGDRRLEQIPNRSTLPPESTSTSVTRPSGGRAGQAPTVAHARHYGKISLPIVRKRGRRERCANPERTD